MVRLQHSITTRFFMLGATTMALLLAGCGSQPTSSDRTQVACIPVFAVPATTTIPVETMAVPAPTEAVQIANRGESVTSLGAFSLVESATVTAAADIEFIYPLELGAYAPSGQSSVPQWVEDSLSKKQLRSLLNEDVCAKRALTSTPENLNALGALKKLRAELSLHDSNTKDIAPKLLYTRPTLTARGDLISTDQGILITGLSQDFLPPQPRGNSIRPSMGAGSDVNITGLFVPAEAALPLMLQTAGGDGRPSLIPAVGVIELQDEVTRPVRRKPGVGVKEQTLLYQGRSGKRVLFSYRELTGGTEAEPRVIPFVHDLSKGSLVTYRGAQFDIVEATPYQIRYRLYSSFTAYPHF